MFDVKKYTLGRARVLSLLSDIDKVEQETAETIYLPAGLSGTNSLLYLEQSKTPESARTALVSHIVDSNTGTVIFWGQSHKLAVSPPFPVKDKFLTGGYDTTILQSSLARDYTIGIILVRLGYYSIGICRGESLVEHKTGTGLVHGRQRQGGSSSNRYRRRREEQTFHFLERVKEHVEEKLAPYTKTLDFLVYGGARTTINEFRKHSRFVAQFDDRLLPPLLSIPEPGYEVLTKAVKQVWTSRITEFTIS
ncbi:MAG TPA: Vms1/Ankzf1 family peptidyl-tRNA hydrolase [Dehalococcoidales bacterium]|nr:Vms1/Ankzf1 family peptidyl-tRNA hydrolase [Dehalococcoidales bacterium]